MKDNELFYKLKPYPFDFNGEREIYGVASIDEIHWHGGDDCECDLKISLLNSQMIEYDRHLLSLYLHRIRENNINKEDNVEDVGMYFYEFSATTRFSLLDIHKIILGMRDEEYSFNELIFYPKLKLYSEGNDKDFDVSEIIEGEILFSASPILTGKVYLKVIDLYSGKDISRNYDKFNDTPFVYGDFDRSKLNSKLKSIFKGSYSKMNCYTYNVGQGNCNYVKLDNLGLFFDIGLTNKDDPNKTYIDKACKEIASQKADVVILSHWDLDHILGITLDNPHFNSCIFIAPRFKDIKSRWISAIRMCAVLITKGADFCLINNEFANSLVYETSNKQITLWKGEIVAKNNINAKNNYGLILKLQGKENMLLPGDCDYDVMNLNPNIFEVSYSYIVVPHHGSVMGDVLPVLKNNLKTGIAYVCQGEKTGNFNADPNLMKNYSRLNYKVKNTKDLVRSKKYRVKLI
jgi:hypothetical protein